MVGCNGYRSPALYAKISSTVDVASHGRLYAGIGAGWFEQEWKAYGYEWPELKDRMGAFAEAVQIVHGMWTQDDFCFSGKYYSVDKPINEPKGVRKPHPSLWIGGGGEKVTLKLVAKYANASNVGDGRPEVIADKLAILKQHCETVGRDYAEIIKSTSLNVFPIDRGDDPERATAQVRGGVEWEEFSRGTVIGTEDEIAAKVDSVLEAGVDYVLFYVPGVARNLDLVARAEAVTRRFP
jgi:alkanesulfonate monooxygenase SsuD/methylene tetrahydromethanopterin reductase-like flavin-dependent oxidoreductase (luciferase family)